MNAPTDSRLPHATPLDTMRVTSLLVLPLVGRGLLLRRPPVVRLLDRMDADTRAVRLLQALRRRYGDGPLVLPIPGRPMALVLAPEDALRVLRESPEPFRVASAEKRAAVAHFQPAGVLASRGPARQERRRFNDAVLEPGSPVHSLAAQIVPKVREEAALVAEAATRSGSLTWDDVVAGWWRAVRRVVLGDAARDDHGLTDLLGRLRADANWVVKPRSRTLQAELDRRLRTYVERAEPGTLAAVVAGTPASDVTEPAQQMPQWLFAFDAAGIATYRTLALLATHREPMQRVRDELRAAGASEQPAGPPGGPAPVPQPLTYLRHCVLESVRLWPTTPAILRDTTTATTWAHGTLPAGSGVVVYVPLFHRDDERLPYAHTFRPDLWDDDEAARQAPLIPFSAGPGMCPGRNLVLLTATTMLAGLLAGLPDGQPDGQPDDQPDGQPAGPPDTAGIRLLGDRLDSSRPLPGTLDPFSLRFAVAT